VHVASLRGVGTQSRTLHGQRPGSSVNERAAGRIAVNADILGDSIDCQAGSHPSPSLYIYNRTDLLQRSRLHPCSQHEHEISTSALPAFNPIDGFLLSGPPSFAVWTNAANMGDPLVRIHAIRFVNTEYLVTHCASFVAAKSGSGVGEPVGAEAINSAIASIVS
jgi:hypothetical protein